MLAQSVLDGGVDVQMGIGVHVVQPVVNDAGDSSLLLGQHSFPLDHRGNGQNLPHGQSAVFRQLAHFLRIFIVKVIQHGVDHPHRTVVDVKLIRIGIQISLQPIGFLHWDILQHLMLKRIGLGGIQNVLRAADPRVFQQLSDLLQRVALWNRDGHGFRVGGHPIQRIDNLSIIHIGVHFKFARFEALLHGHRLERLQRRQRPRLRDDLLLHQFMHILAQHILPAQAADRFIAFVHHERNSHSVGNIDAVIGGLKNGLKELLGNGRELGVPLRVENIGGFPLRHK